MHGANTKTQHMVTPKRRKLPSKTARFDHLEQETYVYEMQISSYFKQNTFHLHCEDKSLNDV